MPRTKEQQRPLSLRQVGRWLLGTALISGLLVGAVTGAAWLLTEENVPLERVRIEGDVRHTGETTLQRALAASLRGSFFSMDLDAVRRSVEALPWVSRASVRRVWPPALVLTVNERRALARWGANGVVSPEGEVFEPEVRSVPAGMARLEGPPGSAPEVVRQYRKITPQLREQGLEIARMTLSERHAWTLELDGGLRLQLGSQALEQRLERFLCHWPELRDEGVAEQVDLRYANGFSVRWSEEVVGSTVQVGLEG